MLASVDRPEKATKREYTWGEVLTTKGIFDVIGSDLQITVVSLGEANVVMSVSRATRTMYYIRGEPNGFYETSRYIKSDATVTLSN